jgi:hypothetical protein
MKTYSDNRDLKSMNADQLKAELERCHKLRTARAGAPGWRANVEATDARISAIKALQEATG